MFFSNNKRKAREASRIAMAKAEEAEEARRTAGEGRGGQRCCRDSRGGGGGGREGDRGSGRDEAAQGQGDGMGRIGCSVRRNRSHLGSALSGTDFSPESTAPTSMKPVKSPI